LTGGRGGGQRGGLESTEHAAADGRAAARHRRRRLAALAACAAGLVVVAAWAATQPPETWTRLKAQFDVAVEWVRGLGAGWFFAAFAVLPAVGFPVSVFAFSAGPLFGPVLGLPTVLALAGASMAASMSISYGLASFVLRPWVTRLLAYLGYTIPVVPPEKRRMFVFLVRATPGPPYVFQSFLLGLARVPYLTYLVISWPVSIAGVFLVIVFGDALAQGNGKVAILAVLGVVLVVSAVKAAQRLLARRARLAAAAAAAGEGEGGEGV
jgi:uncharacterized membrane protein YdjX (TVP38/TMEM64 family)